MHPVRDGLIALLPFQAERTVQLVEEMRQQGLRPIKEVAPSSAAAPMLAAPVHGELMVARRQTVRYSRKEGHRARRGHVRGGISANVSAKQPHRA